jgi:hypothetical protein
MHDYVVLAGDVSTIVGNRKVQAIISAYGEKAESEHSGKMNQLCIF